MRRSIADRHLSNCLGFALSSLPFTLSLRIHSLPIMAGAPIDTQEGAMAHRVSGRLALQTLGATLRAPLPLASLIVLVFLLTDVPASSALPSFSHSYIMTTRQQPGAGDADLTVLPNGQMFFCEAPGSY